jgi:hypothetical protein
MIAGVHVFNRQVSCGMTLTLVQSMDVGLEAVALVVRIPDKLSTRDGGHGLRDGD